MKTISRKHRILATASGVALLMGSLGTSVSAQEASKAPQLEVIVVTAQKRSESLQNVPISITALSEKTIAAERIQNVTDLNGLAPNLTILPQVGGTNAPVYSMRGVIGTGSLPGQDKGVSLYIDGVYMSANNGSVFDLADIQRIEVLKGPQGTLFGRNSTGGAVSIVTHNPTGRFGLQQQFSVGNYDQFRSRTHLELPSFGPLSASVSYLHSERQGDIRNLGAGSSWNYGPATSGQRGVLTSPGYLGDDNTNAVAAAIRLNLAALDVTYKFDYTDDVYTEPGQGILALGDPNFGGAFVAGLLAAQPPANAARLTPISLTRPDAVNAAFSTPGHSVNSGDNLTATYAFNDIVSIKNILAYRDSRDTSTSDASGVGGLVFPGTNIPFIIEGIDNIYHQHQFSDEGQININLQRFKITAGALTFSEHVVGGGFQNTSPTLVFTAVPGSTIAADGSKDSIASSNSNAIFSQVEYNVIDKVTLVGGLRETWDHKFGQDNTVVGAPNNFSLRTNKLTWLAGLNYKPDASTLLYAKASTGFISGGVFNGASYLPETAMSYEAGVKADLLDRRLRTDLAIFDTNYDELQNLKQTLNGSVIVANVGSARARGAEFEGSFAPLSGLTLSAGIGYLDFKYLKLDPAIGTLNNYHPDERPKVTATVSAQYTAPEFSWGGKLSVRVDGRYTSTVYGVPAAIPAAQAAETFPAYWVWNGRISVASIPVSRSKIEVALWVKNLTDDKSAIYSSDLRFIYSAVYDPARTFGIDANYDF